MTEETIRNHIANQVNEEKNDIFRIEVNMSKKFIMLKDFEMTLVVDIYVQIHLL
ncbi:hypothetical protein [Peribacillus butanolivorans]|uniref:hypothetical protein n=1 Tax=Peribacillus butanolivorans TaxID=421767 RepID=UPI000A7262CD|nr:hypothetical protein [Peribacillus butanolivorans]